MLEDGFIIERKYKGKELRVVVREKQFEFEGQKFKSLSSLAKHVTGAKSISGIKFFDIKKDLTTV